MEILIFGILLVALMVWASTRIKRNAAAAFDAEVIETEKFRLNKPDGWLSKTEPAEPYLFEAYTKDFGEEPNQGVRLGNATIETSRGSMDEIASRDMGDGEVIEDIKEVVGGAHYRIIQVTRTDGELDKVEWLKFAVGNGSVYTFRVTILAEAADDLRRGVEVMVDSFEIK